MKTLFQVSTYLKNKFSIKLNNQEGVTTMETLIVIIVVLGILLLVFKPQITNLFTNVLGIWSTDVTTMFNNAQ